MLNNLKIGITIGAKCLNELFNCGIHTNVINIYKLLESIPDFNVKMLSIFDIDLKSLNDKHPVFDDIDIGFLNDEGKNFDIIIFMGGLPYIDDIIKLHNMRKIKLIYYKCGNDFINLAEKILWDEEPKKERDELFTYFDEVWYVPQQKEQNHNHYKLMFRNSKIIQVPFVWHPRLLDYEVNDFERKNKLKPYDLTKVQKTLGICEPNISTVKLCLVPMLIAEQSYRTSVKEKISSLIVTNAIKYQENGNFKTFCHHLDLQNDGKLSIEHRYKITYILNDHIDIVISHQQYNPLNYLYLDCVYLGYPILHNGDLCKDIGYFYDGYDIDGASEKLNYILNEHDKEHDKYLERNRKALEKYNFETNPQLTETYKNLIYDSFFGNNETKEWNSLTNLFF